ncbi:MAG: hypothetical protein J5504_11715 [Butyrivibrio sp.]|nr:hypothetical protein [Butyrivibrio sp.]
MGMDKRIIEQYKKSFDELCHHDENVEYWYAREIREPLGYERWENFNKAISRAIIAWFGQPRSC